MAANRGLDAGAPVRMLASGPSRLCQAMSNGLDIASAASPLEVRDDGFTPGEVMVTARIGIKHAVDWPLRFALAGHSCVSGPRGRTATAFVPSKIPSY